VVGGCAIWLHFVSDVAWSGRFTPSHPEHIHGQPSSQQAYPTKNARVGGDGRQGEAGHGDHARA
jgi:hypothetical protein